MSKHVTHEYELYSIRTYVTYRNVICPNVSLHTKICLVSELMLHTKSVMSEHLLRTNEMCSVRTYVTYENAICPNLLRTKIWCIVSDLLLHTKMCHVWLCYPLIWNVFCPNLWCIRNFLCPNVCYTRKYVFSPKWRYIRQFYMSEPMLPTKYDFFFPNLRYIRKLVIFEHFTHEYELYSVRYYVHYIQTCTTSKRMLQTKIWCLVSKLILHTKRCYVRTNVTHENITSRVGTCYIQNV